MHKPQPEIFRLGAERVGLPPEECVFVDDLRENCEGAEAVGMTAVLHRGADTTIRGSRSCWGWRWRSAPRPEAPSGCPSRAPGARSCWPPASRRCQRPRSCPRRRPTATAAPRDRAPPTCAPRSTTLARLGAEVLLPVARPACPSIGGSSPRRPGSCPTRVSPPSRTRRPGGSDRLRSGFSWLDFANTHTARFQRAPPTCGRAEHLAPSCCTGPWRPEKVVVTPRWGGRPLVLPVLGFALLAGPGCGDPWKDDRLAVLQQPRVRRHRSSRGDCTGRRRWTKRKLVAPLSDEIFVACG